MREFLFRGKRIDNGEWVIGDLVHRTQFYGIPDDCYFILTDGEFHADFYYSAEVDCKTIGQYTGINVGADKLFEGDIIEWVEDYDDNWGDSKTYIGRSLVIWDNDNSCWAAKTDTYIQFFNDFSWDRCYVIGNIHDNPELLQKDDAE